MNEPDLCLIGAVETREDMLRVVHSLTVHVVLMDLAWMDPFEDTLESMLEIERMNKSRVIIVTDDAKEERIIAAIGHFATNYLAKSCLRDIPDAVRAAYQDCSPLHFTSASAIRKRLVQMQLSLWRQQLTEAEMNVIRLADQGQSYRQMAEELYITERGRSRKTSRHRHDGHFHSDTGDLKLVFTPFH